MMKTKPTLTIPIFQKVYIPHIWKTPVIIAVLLLEELLKHSKMSARKGAYSLFDLMRFLCVHTGNVVLVKRGSYIEGERYIALWPDPHCVGSYTDTYLNSLRIASIPKLLLKLAKKSREPISECINVDETNGNTERFLSRLNVLEEGFFQLIDNREIALMCRKLKATKGDICLNHLGNNISIVFQNAQFVRGENLLFTGDLEKEFLSKIESNYDKKYQLYPTYDFIKVPHHGTKGNKDEHYFDFKPYNPKCFMIPNGRVHGIKGNWQTCKKYGNDINLKGAKAICSNSDFCENNSGRCFVTCLCTKRQFVFPNKCLKVT